MNFTAVKVGMRVFLAPGFFTPSESHPVLGSLFEMPGTVIKIPDESETELGFKVIWDNNITDYYPALMLILKNDSKLTKEEVRIGDRVKLSSDSGFRPTPSFPMVGSKYECTGTITRVGLTLSNDSVEVQWDNGAANVFSVRFLERVAGKINPNLSFKLWKVNRRKHDKSRA